MSNHKSMLGPNRIRKDTMIKYQEAGHPRSRGWKQEGDVAAVFVFVFVIKYKAGEAGRGCSGCICICICICDQIQGWGSR